MKHAVFAFVIVGAASVLWASACSTPPTDARVGIDAPPLATFSSAANLLDQTCGSLDCHGNVQRNLVMWGCYGLRYDANTLPGCRSMGGTNTSPDELNASYRSLVGLEPAVMSDVVANKAANPFELTFMRKAFGQEQHTGGTLFPLGTQLGSDAETCLTAWLAGGSNDAVCTAALNESSKIP